MFQFFKKRKLKQIDQNQIPAHHSPLRHMMNEANGQSDLNALFISNFQEAKEVQGAYVIMEGDWGGQIYLVCPMNKINCDEENLINLLKDLDDIAWGCNQGDGKGIYYEIHYPGEIIGGGMGGGQVKEILWIHSKFNAVDIFGEIEQVISGLRNRLIR